LSYPSVAWSLALSDLTRINNLEMQHKCKDHFQIRNSLDFFWDWSLVLKVPSTQGKRSSQKRLAFPKVAPRKRNPSFFLGVL
jgi:hypothetical protein